MKAGVSTQNQTKSSLSASDVGKEGSIQEKPTAASTQKHPSSDGATALPEERVSIIPEDLVELVSIIPEDLVRGVWNTARTFITHINQVSGD